MKVTINIEKSTYEFIKNLSDEMQTQDNRATASPYYYMIQEEVERGVPEDCGDTTIYQDGFKVDEDELREQMEDENFDGDIEGYIETRISDGDLYRANIMIEHEFTYNSNIFFTEKAVHEHYKLNKHNLRNPRDFILYAYRNKEIELLQKAIHEIAGLKEKK